MVIERFKGSNADEVGTRFKEKGRMLPEGVAYLASWIDAANMRCFQIMESRDAGSLEAWADHWKDLVDFEIVPVVTSAEFWASQPSK